MEAPSAVSKMAIVFPKVPVYVNGPVAPLFREWADIAEAYERAPKSLHEAWLYLGHHPAFWTLQDAPGGVYERHATVATGVGWYQSIEQGVNEDGTIWIEIQPTLWPDDRKPEEGEHNLSTEAATYEQAVLSAAALVHNRYRNDREFLNAPLTDKWYG